MWNYQRVHPHCIPMSSFLLQISPLTPWPAAYMVQNLAPWRQFLKISEFGIQKSWYHYTIIYIYIYTIIYIYIILYNTIILYIYTIIYIYQSYKTIWKTWDSENIHLITYLYYTISVKMIAVVNIEAKQKTAIFGCESFWVHITIYHNHLSL